MIIIVWQRKIMKNNEKWKENGNDGIMAKKMNDRKWNEKDNNNIMKPWLNEDSNEGKMKWRSDDNDE